MPLCSLRKAQVPKAKERFIIFHPLCSDVQIGCFVVLSKTREWNRVRVFELSSFGVCKTLGMFTSCHGALELLQIISIYRKGTFLSDVI
jgi:hypothetical protein